MKWIRWLGQLGANDLQLVGGKNAALGELISELSALGVDVPDGFALIADAYDRFLEENGLLGPIEDALAGLADFDLEQLGQRSRSIREQIRQSRLPVDIEDELSQAYRELCERLGQEDLQVAVRSSATAEDLPGASFAGQHESFLYVQGEGELIEAVKRCFASLFTARAINYRKDMGFDQRQVALSVGVQAMVRADRGCSGVMFTLDTESGFRDVVMINAIYGLGENIVQGRVGPDEFYVHKPTLEQGFASLIRTKVGSKELRLVFDPKAHRLSNLTVPAEERRRLAITREDALQLARWGVAIERHFSNERGAPTPMDIEWAKDGETGRIFVVQARPETVHRTEEHPILRTFRLKEEAEPLIEGLAVGDAIGSGVARLINHPGQIGTFRPGEVLVTETTDPDWEPIMKTAAGIVTSRGGRTSHAAIVARELGIPAVVGAGAALERIEDRASVTVSCAEGDVGKIYPGCLDFEVEEIALDEIPHPKTRIMMNLANPEIAFKQAQLPCEGVGLARMEFIFASWVGLHPLAVTRFETLSAKAQAAVRVHTGDAEDLEEFFVDRLSQGIGTIAAAFWPRPVVLRFSDFKTNEYAHLVGGAAFEPQEENPMIGWRGASRYYHPDFQDGFLLELAAIRRVREVFGLKNLKLMVPFCRTPEEGRKVLDVLAKAGLRRGEDDLEVWVMAEIPSNVLAADEFAQSFDGFSIGSNDLTQLCLGVDRDSERVASLFDERSTTVKRACRMLIETAHEAKVPVGICGQAPSDYPDFAEFLVDCGIDSISLTPDAVVRTRLLVAEAEARRSGRT